MLDPIVLVFPSMRCVVVETERTRFLTFNADDLHRIINSYDVMYTVGRGGWGYVISLMHTIEYD